MQARNFKWERKCNFIFICVFMKRMIFKQSFRLRSKDVLIGCHYWWENYGDDKIMKIQLSEAIHTRRVKLSLYLKPKQNNIWLYCSMFLMHTLLYQEGSCFSFSDADLFLMCLWKQEGVLFNIFIYIVCFQMETKEPVKNSWIFSVRKKMEN